MWLVSFVLEYRFSAKVFELQIVVISYLHEITGSWHMNYKTTIKTKIYYKTKLYIIIIRYSVYQAMHFIFCIDPHHNNNMLTCSYTSLRSNDLYDIVWLDVWYAQVGLETDYNLFTQLVIEWFDLFWWLLAQDKDMSCGW